MTLEKIIEILNSSIGKHLVSRRAVKSIGGPFKGVKNYRIELWDVDSHVLLEKVEVTAHMSVENKSYIIEDLEYKLIDKIFKRYVIK